MNKQTEKMQSELEQRVSEVLFYVWDPIGVNGMPACRSEYDDYVPIITVYLMHDIAETGLDALMLFVMETWIGVRLNKRAQRRGQHLEALRLLSEWKEDLSVKFPQAQAPDYPKNESYSVQLDWSRHITKSRNASLPDPDSLTPSSA
jgi:hypothetical protein